MPKLRERGRGQLVLIYAMLARRDTLSEESSAEVGEAPALALTHFFSPKILAHSWNVQSVSFGR